MKEEIHVAIREVKETFSIKGYMDGKESEYLHLINIVLREVPSGSKVGCGPCDLTAILARLGYIMVGVDDLRNPWHLIGDNIRRIKDFAKELGITLIIEPIEKVQLNQNSFDAVLMVDILEHHLTPRNLFNRALSLLKPNGLLLIETPNTAMLAKRLLLLLGKSNHQVDFLLYNVGIGSTQFKK
ncbi:MAG: class I SAM-dependent methyltransferase [Nitrososphaerota archaeon]